MDVKKKIGVKNVYRPNVDRYIKVQYEAIRRLAIRRYSRIKAIAVKCEYY